MQRDMDDTRRKLGINGMENTEKKELFQKFREHGGEVIDDTPPPKHQMFDKEKQKEFLKKKQGTTYNEDRDLHSSIKLTGRKAGFRHRFSLFFQKIRLYFASTIQNVMDSSGHYLSPKFFSLLKTDGQNKLLDMQLLLTPLIHSSQEMRQQIQLGLSRLGTYHYELLVRMGELYTEREFREILARYNVNVRARVTPRSIGEPLRDMYKKFYILRNFSQSCKAALSAALEIQADVEGKEKIALKRNIDHAKKDISFIMGTLIPKLHLAILNILKCYYKTGNKNLEEFLGITYEDSIGFLTEKLVAEMKKAKTKEQQVFNQQKKEIIQEKNEIKVDTLPNPVKEGLILMKELETDKNSMELSKDSTLYYIDRDDKMFFTEILFREMDQEYSFILTSNQIRLNVDYHEGKKVDLRQELSDLYIEFNHIREQVDEYNKSARENFDIEKSPQYTLMQKSKLLHSLSINITKTSRQVRDRFGKLMSRMENILKLLLNDFNNEKRILENPEDKINFDMNLSGRKKMEDTSVLDCLVMTFYFVSALRYRLLIGDLAGLGAKIERVLVFKDESTEDNSETGEEDLIQAAEEEEDGEMPETPVT